MSKLKKLKKLKNVKEVEKPKTCNKLPIRHWPTSYAWLVPS